MTGMFGNEEYHTDPRLPQPWLQRLLPGCRLPFVRRALFAVLSGRREARGGRFDDAAFIHHAEMIATAVEQCGGVLHVTGMKHLDRLTGPAVFVGNHMSLLETFLLPGIIVSRTPVSFVVKESLIRSQAMGDMLKAQKGIAIARENPREDFRTVMEEGAARIAEGRSVCIFPQGTRQAHFKASAFNSMGAKLARRTGIPVVPFALKTDFLSEGRIIRDVGRVHPERDVLITFGPAISEVSDPREAHQTCVGFVRRHLEEWGVPCTD